MSFNYTAAGDKRHVVAQLRQVADGEVQTGTGEIGADVARLLADHIDQDHNYVDGESVVYVVKASGHSGGSLSTMLNVSVMPHYVPDVAVAADPEPVQPAL